jgi:hypothetical protein
MIYILAEGHGEIESASKLINKMWVNLQLPLIPIANAIRWSNLHKDQGLLKGVDFIRNKPNARGLIILRDDEDNCPANLAPLKAAFLRTLNAPFPIAYVIMYREYETIFISYLDHFNGQTVPHLIRGTIQFKDNINTPANPEAIRDAKGYITSMLVGGTTYKPTTDQLSLTQSLDINLLRVQGLPCIGTLERALIHIAVNLQSSTVYP